MEKHLKYIALCGAPGTGKSEVQRILEQKYSVASFDDGNFLRKSVMSLYDLEEWHVTTQEGKATLIKIGDKEITVRKLMGDLGLHLEKYDPDFISRRALKDAMKQYPDKVVSFGSIRMNQGNIFKDTGHGIVVEVLRNGFEPVNSFDFYNKEIVDIQIKNPFDEQNVEQSLKELEYEIDKKLGHILKSL